MYTTNSTIKSQARLRKKNWFNDSKQQQHQPNVILFVVSHCLNSVVVFSHAQWQWTNGDTTQWSNKQQRETRDGYTKRGRDDKNDNIFEREEKKNRKTYTHKKVNIFICVGDLWFVVSLCHLNWSCPCMHTIIIVTIRSSKIPFLDWARACGCVCALCITALSHAMPLYFIVLSTVQETTDT